MLNTYIGLRELFSSHDHLGIFGREQLSMYSQGHGSNIIRHNWHGLDKGLEGHTRDYRVSRQSTAHRPPRDDGDGVQGLSLFVFGQMRLDSTLWLSVYATIDIGAII